MEIIELASTAVAIAAPYLGKVVEGTASKIGESVWELIKEPFKNKDTNLENLSDEELKNELVKILQSDSSYKERLKEEIKKVQLNQSNNTQTIVNQSSVEKQINNTGNIGSITL
ncbi:conserved hypothetical protein [Tenacibaculum maritimum]|uniref:hypothetical protein n=1 Tax=Tenacibaculum maritimum TaxID=107401 RepID=UPI0012E6DFB1|nr:hypothetical protein [Tenacibaculum maritimum]MCD9584035.1 hypothetical protein [Tenacibaculum maritimum]CAA0140944.1 conserved hypothetical protein [Tenacibaculum maritimum]